MTRVTVGRRAEEALRRELQPGEHVAACAEVTSDPSRWGLAAALAAALAMTAAGLEAIFGPVPAPSLVFGFAGTVLALSSQFLARPAYVAVTSRRMICGRLSRSRMIRRLAFAVPLADLRITSYRPAEHPSRICCQLPGGTRIRLDARRTGRTDFTAVAMALTCQNAFTTPDPPWPLAAGC